MKIIQKIIVVVFSLFFIGLGTILECTIMDHIEIAELIDNFELEDEIEDKLEKEKERIGVQDYISTLNRKYISISSHLALSSNWQMPHLEIPFPPPDCV